MNSPDKKTLNLIRFGTPNPGLLKRLGSFLIGNGYLDVYNSQRLENYWTAIYSYQQANKTELAEKGYGRNVIVYSVINTIARTAAQAPWGVYRIKDKKKYAKYKGIISPGKAITVDTMRELLHAKEQALEPYDTHYLNNVFLHPNEQQSGVEYMENLLGFKLLTGDSYEYGNLTEAKKLAELWVMPSHHMEILTNGYGVFPQREMAYRLQIGTNTLPFTAQEVSHSKYWSPIWDGSGSQLYGFSPLDAAWVTVLQDNEARNAAVELLQNRGARGIFSYETDKMDYDEFVEQHGRFEEAWVQRNKEYRSKVMPVFGRGQWHNIGLNAKDLTILEICNMSKDDICTAYGVSSILFNNNDHSTYDNYITARKDLITRAVMPLLTSVRDARNRKLQGDWNPKGENIAVDFDATVFTELYDDVWKMVERMRAAGCFTDNEIRIQANYEALPNPVHNEVWKRTSDVPVSMINEKTLTRQNSSNE